MGSVIGFMCSGREGLCCVDTLIAEQNVLVIAIVADKRCRRHFCDESREFLFRTLIKKTFRFS